MEIGRLYKTKNYFWLVSPSKAIAYELRRIPFAGACVCASSTATYLATAWSKKYNCEIVYFSPDSYILLLEEDGNLKKILTSDGRIGWILVYGIS